MQQFCVVVKGKVQDFGNHLAGICRIEWLDLTLASWFL
jgi:hypothetical protein